MLVRMHHKVIKMLLRIQLGCPDSRTASLSGNYVDGVSIIHGTPPTHIWTYAAGASVSNSKYGCPCNTEPGVQPPTFVGSDYYCETGTTQSGSWCTNDPLWDGM